MILCLARESQRRRSARSCKAQANIISKSGAWYAYEGDKIGQGRENAKTYIRENPAFLICLRNRYVTFTLINPRKKRRYRSLLTKKNNGSGEE